MVDSPGDLPLETADKYGVLVVPVKFTFDGENLIRDKYDMTTKEFYKTERETGTIPKTMQITPFEFEEIFKKEAESYDEIIFITIGSKASGIYNNAVNTAKIVSEETGVKIYIVDSKCLAYSYGYTALCAAKMVQEGKSSDEILEKINRMLDTNKTYFAVETLDYLKKGGRITTMSAVIGGVLDIRPILKIEDSLTTVIEKVKGEKKVLAKFVQIALKDCEGKENAKIFVLNSDVDEKAQKLKEMFEAEGLTVAGFGDIGPVIGCHAGPGVLGFCIIFEE